MLEKAVETGGAECPPASMPQEITITLPPQAWVLLGVERKNEFTWCGLVSCVPRGPVLQVTSKEALVFMHGLYSNQLLSLCSQNLQASDLHSFGEAAHQDVGTSGKLCNQ